MLSENSVCKRDMLPKIGDIKRIQGKGTIKEDRWQKVKFEGKKTVDRKK